MSADGVKFRKPVLPGDTMFIHAELTKSRGERLAKAGGRFIDTALLEKSVCLGCVGNSRANAEEEEKRKDQAHMGQRFRDEHV